MTEAVIFVCVTCNETSSRIGQLKPTVCDDCKEANRRSLALKRGPVKIPKLIEPEPGIRRCIVCSEDKPHAEYGANKGGLRRDCRVCQAAKRQSSRAAKGRDAEYAVRREQLKSIADASRPSRVRAKIHASRTRKAYAKIDAHFAAKRRAREAALELASKPWVVAGAQRSAWQRTHDRPSYALRLLQGRVKKVLYKSNVSWADLGCGLEDVLPIGSRLYCHLLIGTAEAAFPGKDVFSLETGFKMGIDHFGGCTVDGLRGLLALDNVRVESNHHEDKPWLAGEMSSSQRDRIRASMDPEFAIELRLRRRMVARQKGKAGKINKEVRNGVKGRAANKATFRFVGYTPADLRIHLESLFTPEMSWEAFMDARIHLDHVRPLASFDLTDDTQLKAAWALTNLQPLWALDNMMKGAKWDGPANDNAPLPTPVATRKSYWQNMTAEQTSALAARDINITAYRN